VSETSGPAGGTFWTRSADDDDGPGQLMQNRHRLCNSRRYPARVVPFTTSTRLLGEAAAAFLAQPDLAASTRHSYQQTLGRLERAGSPTDRWPLSPPTRSPPAGGSCPLYPDALTTLVEAFSEPITHEADIVGPGAARIAEPVGHSQLVWSMVRVVCGPLPVRPRCSTDEHECPLRTTCAIWYILLCDPRLQRSHLLRTCRLGGPLLRLAQQVGNNNGDGEAEGEAPPRSEIDGALRGTHRWLIRGDRPCP
jgi:hypothetical protein